MMSQRVFPHHRFLRLGKVLDKWNELYMWVREVVLGMSSSSFDWISWHGPRILSGDKNLYKDVLFASDSFSLPSVPSVLWCPFEEPAATKKNKIRFTSVFLFLRILLNYTSAIIYLYPLKQCFGYLCYSVYLIPIKQRNKTNKYIF